MKWKIYGAIILALALAVTIPAACQPIEPTLTPTATVEIEPTVTPTDIPGPTETATPPEPTATAVVPTATPTLTGELPEGAIIIEPGGSISDAVRQAEPGDVFVVLAGEYNESVRISTSGTAEQPITLMAWGAVTINGGSSSAITTSDADYWTIQGFTLRSTDEWAIQASSWSCRYDSSCDGAVHWELRNLTVYGQTFHWGSYLLMEGCELDGSSTHEHGVYAAYTHHNTYRNNEVHHFRLSGIREQGLNHNALIEDNHVYDIGGANLTIGISADGHNNSQYGHIIRGNLVENVDGTCIELENTFASLVEGNELHGCGDTSITVIGYAAPACKENGGYGGDDCWNAIFGVTVSNNTISSPHLGLVLYHAGGVTLVDNVLNVRLCSLVTDNPPNVTWVGNVCNGQPYED